MPVQMMLEPVRSYVSGTISGSSPCRVSSMRPRSSNLPKVHLPPVGVVFAGEVILQVAHQVLQHIHVFAPRAHHTQPLHEHGPILGGKLVPVPLARICN